jgi:catechol 2,3-dioxygenase-like lactoylglutathione lyase family enzyme
LVVADVTVALEWWHDRLGAEIIEQSDGYVLLGIGAGYVHLAEAGEPPPDRNVELIPPPLSRKTACAEVVITVENCQSVAEALQKRGIQLLGPPSTPPWGGEVRAFTRDPDAHLVELTSST